MDQNLQAINIVSAKQYVTRVLWKKNYHSSFLSGDWNAKHTAWGARLVTPKGRNLFQALSSYNSLFQHWRTNILADGPH